MSKPALQNFPFEIIINILDHLDNPVDVLNSGLACKNFQACSEDNAIWAGFTRLFKYWTTEDFRTSANPDWKSEIKRRYLQIPQIDSAVDGLIQNSLSNLLPKFQLIREEIGLEAKDRLLFHMRNTPDDAPDVLAIRYWSQKLFGICQKQFALDALASALENESLPPEQVLAAVDMMVIENESADFGVVNTKLDQLTNDFKVAHINWETYQTRDLLQQVATYLIEEKGFKGPERHDESTQFDDLQIAPQCFFISKVLSNKDWSSFPLVDTVIFCAILNRLGLQASPICYLKYYFVLVHDVKSNRKGGNELPEKIYFDFFNRKHGIKSLDDLKKLVANLGVDELPIDILTPSVLIRHMEHFSSEIAESGWRLLRISQEMKEIYSYMSPLHEWLTLILSEQISVENSIRSFCDGEKKADANIWNVPLLSAYLMKRAAMKEDKGLESIAKYQKASAESFDSNLRINTFSRARAPNLHSKLRVGDCARHKRNGLDVFVTSWVPHVPFHKRTTQFLGSGTSFDVVYKLIDENGDWLIAQQSSLQKIDSCSNVFIQEAGRYFLRWDDKEKKFISNRKEYYPED